MRFKLIPRWSETLPLPPLLGHAVLMVAVPLLAHAMQTHSLSLSLQPGWVGFFVFFVNLAIKLKKIMWSFKVAAVLSSASLLCVTLCIIQRLYSGADRPELHAWLQSVHACKALTLLSNLFEISVCLSLLLLRCAVAQST